MNNHLQNNNENPAPYSVRVKASHTQIYVPSIIKQSIQQYAWIELVDPPEGKLLDLLYDPCCIADWKIDYLQQAYEEFRDAENERKRGGTLSYSNLSVELPAQTGLYTTVALETEEQADARLTLAGLLAELRPEHRRHFHLHFIDKYTFVEIARLENPDADKADIDKRANSIGRAVKRNFEKLQKNSQTDCPVPAPPTGG
ncbi:sigma-70 family RNA polymerase sigma factor [Corynebacterium sp. sy039]|uniref:sigma-70 family RNA polymerase sigma factor n=1 Tax=Corynebacterium sp. sy039 TaxID=2599641 RepID=UPI0011B4654E|nr:sigma-70 family RNA polymerase sigma factor [Corynebacterium sp. sy039]QDZ42455.1 sigma-70 family RNA polymerase sigma factor [Corynebacterium sp. sy039]